MSCVQFTSLLVGDAVNHVKVRLQTWWKLCISVTVLVRRARSGTAPLYLHPPTEMVASKMERFPVDAKQKWSHNMHWKVQLYASEVLASSRHTLLKNALRRTCRLSLLQTTCIYCIKIFKATFFTTDATFVCRLVFGIDTNDNNIKNVRFPLAELNA